MARQDRPLLTGSITDKMDRVDALLRRLNRRRGNYVIGVTPPIPVFDWTKEPDEDGVVFRKLMPGNGKITIGCMYVREFDKNASPIAVLNVEGQMGGRVVVVVVVVQTQLPSQVQDDADSVSRVEVVLVHIDHEAVDVREKLDSRIQGHDNLPL